MGKARWLRRTARGLAAGAALSGCVPVATPHLPPGASFAALQRPPRQADPAILRLAARLTDPRPSDIQDREIGWQTLDLGQPPSLGLATLDADDARRLNGLMPALGESTPPAPPFFLRATGPERDRAMLCLTQAIYYEAALEPDAGQAAVAQTVINRVRHPAYPHNICGVVYQGAELGMGCQFTFVCDGSLDRRPVGALWRRAGSVAERAVNGYVMASVGSATHYHADYVFPRWGPTLVKIGQIGAHIFYRFPGPVGLPGALRQSYRGDELRVAMSGSRPAVTLVDTITAPTQNYFYVVPRADLPRRRPAPGEVVNGRRVPTPEEIAQINAALAGMDRYPGK